MELDRLSANTDQIATSIRTRLTGNDDPQRAHVNWMDRGERLLIDLKGLEVQVDNGWLVCRLPLRAPRMTPVALDLVYFVGRNEDGDGLGASGTVRVTGEDAERYADLWGHHLLRVVWDGILDVLEGAIVQVERSRRVADPKLVGFTGVSGRLVAETVSPRGR